MNLLDTIKQAALEAVRASNPVNLLYGEVIELNPLKVNVDQRFTLTADFLILTAALTELKVTVEGIEYIIRPGLMVGDKLLLIRIQGGQKYAIIDKVVAS